MDKIKEYQKLIETRKNFEFPIGLSNYSQTGIELKYVDGWEAWHNDLDADIMLVGQDFTDTIAFKRDGGKIEPDGTKFKYATNKNLVYLFKEGLGIDIGNPNDAFKIKNLFFTNALVGLKEGGMQGAIHPIMVYKIAEIFLKSLIEIVQPKIIITLGILPFQVINALYDFKLKPNVSLNTLLAELVKHNYETDDHIKIFPVYHCGGRGVNMNRNIEEQLEDWKRIKVFLNK